jgi:hypothetical protein
MASFLGLVGALVGGRKRKRPAEAPAPPDADDHDHEPTSTYCWYDKTPLGRHPTAVRYTRRWYHRDSLVPTVAFPHQPHSRAVLSQRLTRLMISGLGASEVQRDLHSLS